MLVLLSLVVPWLTGGRVGGRILSVDADPGLPAAWSVTMFAGTAVLSAIQALLTAPGDRSRIAWWGVAVVTGLMALDEGIMIHERVDRIVEWIGPEHGFGHFAWLFIGVPVAVVLALAVMWVVKVVGSRPKRWLILGFVVFFAGAIGVEAVGALITRNDPAQFEGIPYRLLLHLEELLELVGAAFLVCAPLSALHVSRTEGQIVLTRHPDASRASVGDSRA